MEAWHRVKRTSSLSSKQLAAVREVAAWREETAQRRNLPRRWVLADEVVVEIARRLPKTPDDILPVRTVSQRMNIKEIRKVIDRINKAIKAGPSTWPKAKRSHRDGIDAEAAIDLLSALAHLRARENSVSASLLAPHDEIVKLAHGETEGVSIVEGWRKALVGDDMLALLDGKLLLSLNGHELKVTDLRQSDDRNE
jgi:ribonuclease D